MLFLIISEVLALIITYQDFKYRMVDILLFPLIFIIGIIMNYPIGIGDLFDRIIWNLVFLMMISLVAYLYYIVKFRSIKTISRHVGLGDILFLLCIIPYLKINDYIYFLCCSFLLCLLIFFPFSIKRKSFQIPLAGFQAMLFCPLLIAQENDVEVFGKIQTLAF